MSSIKEVSCSNSFQRGTPFLALAVIFSFFLAFTAQSAFAQGVVASGIFELDGDSDNDGNVDWDDLIPGTGGPVWDVLLNQGLNPVTAENDFSDTDKIFTNGGGTKDFKDVSTWQFRTGDPGPKFDLTNAYAAFASDLNGDYIFFGQDRQESNGDAQLGFWFLQTPQLSLPAGDTGTFNCQMGADGLCHVLGDILVLADFSNGGAIANIKVFRWNSDFSPASIKAKKNCDETDNIQRLGDQGAGFDLGTDGDWSDSSCNTAADEDSVQGGLFGVCGDDPGDLACAITNASGTSPVNWGYRGVNDTDDVVEQGFFEGGINVRALLGSTPCFSNAVAESRASDSVSSILKDFVLLDFNVCKIDAAKSCQVTDFAVGETETFIGLAQAVIENSGPGTFIDGDLVIEDKLSDGTANINNTNTDKVTLDIANNTAFANEGGAGFDSGETITYCSLYCEGDEDITRQEALTACDGLASGNACGDTGSLDGTCAPCDFPSIVFLTDANGPTNTVTGTVNDTGGVLVVGAEAIDNINQNVACTPIDLDPAIHIVKECDTTVNGTGVELVAANSVVKVKVNNVGDLCNLGTEPLVNATVTDNRTTPASAVNITGEALDDTNPNDNIVDLLDAGETCVDNTDCTGNCITFTGIGASSGDCTVDADCSDQVSTWTCNASNKCEVKLCAEDDGVIGGKVCVDLDSNYFPSMTNSTNPDLAVFTDTYSVTATPLESGGTATDMDSTTCKLCPPPVQQ